MSTQPNILIIQPDQHRGTIMGCAGDTQVQTPHLDHLAAQGIRFSHAVSASPVCCPFRGTLQTGLYQHTHRVDGNNIRLNPKHTGFAELFANAGYATGYIGKWHLDGGIPEDGKGYVPPDRRFGWQEWHGYEKSHEFFNVWQYDQNQQQVRLSDYDWEPTWHTDMALDFTKRHRDANTPWLYYLGYGPPHKPEQCPQEFLDQYDPNTFQLPPDVKDRFSPQGEQELRRIYQMYYGQVSAIDHEIGRITQGLDDLGIADNTIIFYISDHGDHLGSHGTEGENLRGKSSPYATAFRIPFIVRWPGKIPSGQTCDALVNSIDLTPTLLDFADIDIPTQMLGQSMTDWCFGKTGPRQDAVYLGVGGATRPNGWRAIWDGQYIYSPTRHNILYDHHNDPYEMQNRMDDPNLNTVQKRLSEQLIDFAKTTHDPMLTTLQEIEKQR